MNVWKIVSLAGLAGLAVVVAACSGSNDVTSTKGMGTVQLTLSAASPTTAESTLAADEMGTGLESANATLTSILARNTSGQLVPVETTLPKEVDLMELRADRTVDLDPGLLVPGEYDQFVVVIKALEVVTMNGTRITVEPPGGGWTSIVPTRPFSVIEDHMTSVTLKFRKWASFRWIEDKIEFHPEFECEMRD